MRALPLILLLAGAVAAAADQGGVAAARAGQVAALTVTFPLKDQLINRSAPNQVSLSTPWGKVSGKPGGKPHTDPQFLEYYASVQPLVLKVRVPGGARPGAYSARVEAQLFACDQQRKLCVQRSVTLPATIHVLKPGEVRAAQPLRITDDLLAPRLQFQF